MKNHLEKLLRLLAHATELYQSLHAVIEKEKDAVVGLNLQQLNEACKSKDNLLLKLRILEEQREKIMDKLAAEFACSPQNLTLNKLAQLVEESYAHQLRDRSTDLLALIETLQDASQHNKFLMSHSLELIRGSYNLLNNLATTNLVYYRSGNLQNNAQSGKLLTSDI
jgi:flagellar biosynthesis/type III secretory pathway chaperone